MHIFFKISSVVWILSTAYLYPMKIKNSIVKKNFFNKPITQFYHKKSFSNEDEQLMHRVWLTPETPIDEVRKRGNIISKHGLLIYSKSSNSEKLSIKRAMAENEFVAQRCIENPRFGTYLSGLGLLCCTIGIVRLFPHLAFDNEILNILFIVNSNLAIISGNSFFKSSRAYNAYRRIIKFKKTIDT